MTIDEAKERLYKNWWAVVTDGKMAATRKYFKEKFNLTDEDFNGIVKEISVRKTARK